MDAERLPIDAHPDAPVGPTNAYLVGGDEPLLVDPAGRTERLDDAVERRGVSHLAVTHAHFDHVGGVAHYAREHDVTVWARAGREARFEERTGVAPDRTFREGTTVGPTTVIETPGHAPDHVAFLRGNAAISGDVAVADGSVVVGTRDGDMRAYLTTLRRLHAMDLEALHPGHGDVVSDPRSTLSRLIDHRLRREGRVLDAVRAGAETADEVLDAAYEKDLSGVREMARETVMAHLAKLDAEGRVEWDGDRARIA